MDPLIVSRGVVTTITLNRPDVRNALNEVLIGELARAAADLGADAEVRAVVLRGAGSAFCAVADLTWMSRQVAASQEENLADARRAARMFLALDALPKPLIGQVHGAALGGGAGLAAICDIVVATDDATFGFPETTIGILPALIAPYVVRKIGLGGARAICLTGERFSAERALALGLVHHVVSSDRLDATVGEITAQCLRASPSAVAVTKGLLRAIAGSEPGDVLALTSDSIAAQRVTPEGQEGMRAFLEKRRPSWRA